MEFKKVLMGLSLVAAASGASAATIMGSGLQNGLDAITTTAGDSVGANAGTTSFMDVTTSQIAADEIWQLGAANTTTSTLVFEFAGFAGTNSFGIYDLQNTANRLTIFGGAATSGQVNVVLGPGNVGGTTLTQLAVGGSGAGPVSSISIAGQNFGYFLDSSAEADGGLFFSRASDNTGADQGDDHLAAFAGDESFIDSDGNGTFSEFQLDTYILAWEDVKFGAGSDKDFSDMVVLVSNVTPVSEPATLAIFGLGLLGLGAVRRRKQAK